MLVNPFTGRQFVAPQHLCQRECKYRNILELRRVDFIKILRKQLVFPKKLMNPHPFHSPSSTRRHLGGGVFMVSRKAVRPQQGRWSLYAIPIQVVYTRTAASAKPIFRGLLRPVLVTRLTSTTSRGDQYCLLLVTSTGSIADQYWSQLPSSAASHNYLYIRAIPHSDLGTSLAPKET